MPEKTGAGGKQQEYDPSTGQYGPSESEGSSKYSVYFTDGGYEIKKPGESPFHYVIRKYPDIDINKKDVLDILNKDFKTDRELLMELASLVNNSSTDPRIGRALLGLFHDDYMKIKEEKFNKRIEPRIQKADEYLVKMDKIKDNNLEVTTYGSNYKNYKKSLDNWVEFDAYTSNCQRCVMAWYLRFKGYDVEAMPYNKESNNKLEKYYNSLHNWSYNGFNIPNDVKWDYHGTTGDRQRTQYNSINDIVNKSPDQSVFFCSVQWRGRRSSHVFIILNDKGTPKYIDPQDNSDASRYFDRSRYKIQVNYTQLKRVDEFSLNGDILPEIVRGVRKDGKII